MPSTPVGSTAVPVDKLETSVLEKFAKAIERGHHLPAALKDMTTDELGTLKASIEDELRSRRAAQPLANRTASRTWQPPRTA